jgi:hypothetical protein
LQRLVSKLVLRGEICAGERRRKNRCGHRNSPQGQGTGPFCLRGRGEISLGGASEQARGARYSLL